MSRNKKDRLISDPPLYHEFQPIGGLGKNISNISMTIDEYEAINLADYMGLNHAEAAIEMQISRPTFTRLIEKARKKVATMIVLGIGIKIEGGNVHFKKNIIKCNNCGHMFKININDKFEQCPNCETSDLFNIAGSLGHGKCCVVLEK